MLNINVTSGREKGNNKAAFRNTWVLNLNSAARSSKGTHLCVCKITFKENFIVSTNSISKFSIIHQHVYKPVFITLQFFYLYFIYIMGLGGWAGGRESGIGTYQDKTWNYLNVFHKIKKQALVSILHFIFCCTFSINRKLPFPCLKLQCSSFIFLSFLGPGFFFLHQKSWISSKVRNCLYS